ncbi:MAG: hypothetical protein FJ145_17615 [Deltaproteobacteria bacterium]|nr:hypothetical protein [Deltaproteobacteria bacterium]
MTFGIRACTVSSACASTTWRRGSATWTRRASTSRFCFPPAALASPTCPSATTRPPIAAATTLPYVSDKIGEAVIPFASDYPHWDGNSPYMVSTVRERNDITETHKQKVLQDNAIRLYGWDR